jgi:signal transduction histidine kinase
MGSHMMPGRERWRATRRSIRFTMTAIMAIPVVAVIVMWGLAGFTISAAIAGHSQNTNHGTVLIRIALAAGVGLLAILVAAAVMGWFARRVAKDVASLDQAARRFADQQLPQLVERLRRGDKVDPASELPPPPQARVTEIARAASALASVERTAVTAATTETSVRSGISQVFVSLARRSQSLLQRQLRLLDDLERKAADPGALADLFPLDHLTTRMRRHAEGLIILSGAVPGRAWSSPVPVIDVIRGAIAEVEDYKRIAVVTNSEDMVAGSAVADMIHLLAELIENAALFSPSGTRVEVRAERVGNGFAFEIEDRGLGIKPEELDAINQQLSSPTDFDLANADQLGLFVVSRLAARHGLRVFLRPSPYGGTTAIVVLPRSMVTPEDEAPPVAQLADHGASARWSEDLQLALTGRQARRIAPVTGAVPNQPGTDSRPAEADERELAFPGRASLAPGASYAQPTERTEPSAPGQPGLPSRTAPRGPADPGPLVFPRRTPATSPAETDSGPGQPVSPRRTPAAGPAEPDTSPGQPVFPRPTAATGPAETDTGPGQPGQPVLPRRTPAISAAETDGGPGQPGQPVQPRRTPASGPAEPDSGLGQPFFPRYSPAGGLTEPDSSPGQPVFPSRPGPSSSAGTHLGLPRRVRQANLSPHLRHSASASGAPSKGAEARSPEQAKSLLASLQRGWERGRQADLPESEATPSQSDAGDSTREGPQEEA